MQGCTRIVVSITAEKAIEEKNKELGCNKMHDGDPYLQKMALSNLHYVSIFG